jgi:2-methylcitrate dehydratase PrpD
MALTPTPDDGGITRLETVKAVVLALGGTDAVASLTRRSAQAVSNWISTGRISPRLFWLMTAVLAKRGFTAPAELWSQEAEEIA